MLIGIELNALIPITKREKLKDKLIKIYFYFGAFNLVLAYISLAMLLYQFFTDLTKTGTVWTNFILVTTTFQKTIHMKYNLQRIEQLIRRIQKVFESSHVIHYHRYQKNLKINIIVQVSYLFAVYGTDLTFFSIPIIQNIVALLYGADHWERIIQHQLYFPYSLEPWFIYILTYTWIQFAAFMSNGYIVANEILFDTLLVMISMEFDNLADEFEDFDFEHPDLEEFKKLKNRHSELLEIADEMNSIYNFPIMVSFFGCTAILCFSLLQVFVQGQMIFSSVSEIPNLIKFSSFLSAGLLQIFLLSFFCEKLRTSSENIAKKIANSNWYMCKDIGMKKNYQMVLLKAQQPVELTALNFFGINIEIFTHVISTAYSYFGILKSFR
ncbi:putative Odorant receptor 67a [Polypedilum vanderplanki]|uniref:Odorant receptor n=1 Tax=Polypedilum vanderplanki TaxID=319348 RepID=A0A9J6BLP1_POLVA|nr:putative Odorant receptor 67a [Polypedilum vanderplanki]